jgi:hypothetical protein
MDQKNLDHIKTLLSAKFRQREEFCARDIVIFLEEIKEPNFEGRPEYSDKTPDIWVHKEIILPLLKSGFLEKDSDYKTGDFKRVYYVIKIYE